jgi:hypothetical protein
MFRAQTSPAAPANKGSAISTIISLIGTALGVGAAILATPTVFRWTQEPLHLYLSETWTSDVATFLTYVMACVEACVIYGMTKLLFMLLTTLATAAVAARRFPGVS